EWQGVNNVTACATALATRIPAINLDQGPSVPLGFVSELPNKFPPRRIIDVFGEGAVADHVRDSEALHHDRLVLTDQAGGELLEMVPAPVGNPGVDASNAL